MTDLPKAVLLAGCSPNSGKLRNIYIVSVSSGTTIVRAGYFGICSISKDSSWRCTSPGKHLFADLSGSDPQHVIETMSHFTGNVIYPGLL
jgi:hypothetical protein